MPITLGYLRQRRAERERKEREHRARIRRIRIAKLAKQFVGVTPTVIQPTDQPLIPTATQQEVAQDLAKQRTAFTPLGGVGVGAQTAAPETRGKPEFGSWTGSGILENLVGGALPTLENLQKGIETVGGAVVGTAGALTPGDLFGFEENIRQIKQEGVGKRGGAAGFWDVAGQAQELAKAFRATDMPSMVATLPGGGIPLPGGRKIEDIDVGVKGAIELVPEIVIGIATGGTSVVGGIGRRTVRSAANALGYDIARGAVKVSTKTGRATVKAVSASPSVAGKVADFADFDKAVAGIDRVFSPDTVKAIGRLPERMRGPVTATLSAISPGRFMDTSRAIVKAMLVNAKGLDQVQKQKDITMAEFVRRTQAAGIQKIPTEVEEFTGKVEGLPFSTGPGGTIGNTGIDAIDKGVTMRIEVSPGKWEKRTVNYTYNEIFENLFKGDNVAGAKQFLADGKTLNPVWVDRVMNRSNIRKEFGGGNIGIWDETAERYIRDPSSFTPGTPAIAGTPDTPRGSVKLTKLQKQEIAVDIQPSAEELFYASDDLGLGAEELAFLRKFTDKNGNVVLSDTISGKDLSMLREYAENTADKIRSRADDYAFNERSELAKIRSTARSLDSVVAKIDALPVRKGKKAVDAVKAIDSFDQNAAELATYVRHWQDTGLALELQYVAKSGKEIKKTAKLDNISSRYSPRNALGKFLLEDADVANQTARVRFSGTTPGRKPRAFRERSLSNDEIRALVEKGEYSLATPMQALAEHARSLNKAAWDEQLRAFLFKESKRAGSGVIEIATKKAQAKSAITRAIKDSTNIEKGTIDSIGEQLPATADVLRQAMKHGKDTKVRQDVLKDIVDVLKTEVLELADKTWLPTRAGVKTGWEGLEKGAIPARDRMPAYTGFLFDDKDDVKRLLQRHFPNENLEMGSFTATTSNFTKHMAETGDIIRLGRTGFDFGYWMIQGLPSLGFAVAKMVSPGTAAKATETTAAISNRALGRKLVGIWVKSVPEAFRAFKNEERMMLSLVDDFDIVNEAVGNNLQIGRSSTDAFQAIQRGTILKKSGLTAPLDTLITKAAKPFERAFVAPSDYIRVQFYKAMRPVAAQKGQQGLEELASVLNNMTGALSSSALGIAPSLQNIERGIIAFSPRYTRASLALLSDVFKGGIQGRVARESMAGMLGLGMATYISTVYLMREAGSDQELHLDPTKSAFMTFDIGGDRLGFGSFWTQFAKVTSKLAATAWDEDAREAFLGDDTIRTNPLIRWVRSRSAPGYAGIGWDIAVGEDFLGRDIEGPKDWAKHLGRQTLPIWLEAATIGEPVPTGWLGVAGEVGGARVRPLSSKERRRDLRNVISRRLYDKDWTDLNGLQRDRINAGDVDMSLSEEESLERLNEEIVIANVERGDEEDLVIEKYHKRHTDIEDEWNEKLAEGIEILGTHPETMDLKKFRYMYLSSSNAIRRNKLEELNDPDGEFAVAIAHFEENSERFGEDRPEDIAYNQYITDILATDDFDQPDGYDYDARDVAVQAFQTKWGDEVYAYVLERFATGRNVPLLVSEFWKGRNRFEHFWRDIDEATLASMPNATVLEPTYKEWTKASENRKKELVDTVPHLKKLIAKISDVKTELRKRDQHLDAWLFRWGYYNTLVHPDNEFAPDGVDDARDFWRDPKPLPLSLFGIESGIAL